MEQRLNLITLGVPDFEAARRFYVDGLGWDPVFEVTDDIVFIQIGHGLMMAAWDAGKLDNDAGTPRGGTDGHPRISLAKIVETEQEVADTLASAVAAGATVLKEPQHAEFGGFHCYFADPAGFRWEIATNPGFSVGADGTVAMGPIDD